MDRREYLRITGASGVAAVGAYGAYTTIVRDAWSDPGDPSNTDVLETVEEDDLRGDDDARSGWMLGGITPESRDLSVLDPLETWLGERHAVVGSFLNIGQPDHDEIARLTDVVLESAWQRGHVPHVFWQPFLPNRDETSEEINREIAAGEWDEELEAWAGHIAQWVHDDDGQHRRIYLNLAPEFNGDWSPWSPAVGDDDEEDFVAMWRHVHDTLSGYGLDERFVQWIWTLDNTTRGVDRAACYPGDEYVDWCGVHGYNWSEYAGWQSPEDVYGPTLQFIDDLTERPVAITEFATSSQTADGSHDPAAKNDWIGEAYEYLEEMGVRLSLYFDLTKETDWAVFGGEYGYEEVDIDGAAYEAYPAYREAMRDDGVLGPDDDHPRILSDTEFAGTF